MWPSQEFNRFGFNPFIDFGRLQPRQNRMFSDFAARSAQTFPPINLWTGENSIVVEAELPGLASGDVDITLNQDVLTLRGQRKPYGQQNGQQEAQRQTGAWHRRERTYGSFSRTIQLPFRPDPEKVQARFHHGILQIELVQAESDRPRKIAVNAE
jgi:HSP20 family protein